MERESKFYIQTSIEVPSEFQPKLSVQAIRTERQIQEKVKLCLRASGWRIIM